MHMLPLQSLTVFRNYPLIYFQRITTNVVKFLNRPNHWYGLNGSEVNMWGRLIMVFSGSFTSLSCWPDETAWPNQISVFQKCDPVAYARLGFWNDDYGTLTKLHWLVWEHQAWRYVKHIENVLSLTHYETLMTLIGYCILANQLWYKHAVSQYYRFGHRN